MLKPLSSLNFTYFAKRRKKDDKKVRNFDTLEEDT